MERKDTITILVCCIIAVSGLATVTGILSDQGPGAYPYESIRGQTVTIYGRGVYQHMSAEVAIQGIAQDLVTLFAGIPLLIISLFLMKKGSFRGNILLAGTLGYFLITYLFYLVMGMYNVLFLAYSFLLGAAFFAFTLTMMSFDVGKLYSRFSENTPVKFTGGFLIFNAISIALLWLGIVVPYLLDGTIFPPELDHYTTLVVQGMDLGLLLPIAVVSGVLLIRRKPLGFLISPVYFIFLSLLMTALTAKVVFMGMKGYDIIPVIFIIPSFAFISIICSILLVRSLKEPDEVQNA